MDKIAWIALLIGFVAFVFSSGRWNIFITAWIWPFAFLYFSRNTKSFKQFGILILVIVAGHIIKWYDILGSGALLGAAACMIWAICWVIPFAADRLLVKHFKGVSSTLLFPSVFVSIEVLRSFLIVGSFGSTAYTQSGILPLMQITSVIGSFGLSFIILWLGPLIMYAVDGGFKWTHIKKTAAVYSAVMIFVLGFGFIRLATPVDHTETVRVAAVISPYYREFSDGSYETMPYEKSVDYLISETERASKGNTEIACWNEEAFAILDSEEEAFLKEAERLCKKYELDMVLPYETADTDNSENGLSVNKLVILTEDGARTEYIKTKLVPGVETADYVKGTGDIPTVDTGEAVISAVICFDSDYPGYVNGAGADTNELFEDTDILFVPSWDWESVAKAHTGASIFRAVENGVGYIKPTYDGLSKSVDCYGRVLMEFHTDDIGYDTVQFADIPTESVDTIYSKIGSIIDMVFAAFGVIMVLAGIIIRKKEG